MASFKYPLNPYGGLMVQPVALAGGLNDSQAIADPTTMQVLSNWVVFRGRFAVRAPVTVTVQLLDDQGSPAAITSVLAGRFHKNKFYVLGFSSVTNKTYLYRLNPDGTSEGTPNATQSSPVTDTGTGLPAVVWTGSTLPAPMMVSFDGGIASTPVSRLYIADNNNQYDTRFWNSDSSTLVTLQDDFADTGTLHNTRYTYIWKYQYSMWGSNFFQFGASIRPEMMRFSQPGLIPALEPDMAGAINTAAPGREWWNIDHREVGDRGDPITTVGYAGGASIVFKRRQTYALFGYDADTWAVRTISDKVGAVGPYASCSTEDGLCYFWSDRGPHMCDGQNIYDIGRNIRKFVQAVGFNSNISAEYSVDDSLVYFGVPSSGTGIPNSYLGYQRQEAASSVEAASSPMTGAFSSGSWLGFSGSSLLINSMASIPNQTLPGPQNPPSSLAISVNSDIDASLTWVNGDTSSDTVTEIWRGLSSGTEVKIDQVNSGITFYDDPTLTSTTQYFYKIRHVRNAQNSAFSNEVSGTTFCAQPTAVSASSIPTGVQINYTNNQAGADINVDRSTNGSSFTTIITVPNPGTGAFSTNDTSGTNGVTYYYRVWASKATFVNSPFSTPVVSANFGLTPPHLSAVSHNITLTGQCPSDNNTTVSWTADHVTANDTAKVYASVAGGGFSLFATVPLSQGSVPYTFSFRTGTPNHDVTLQFKVEAWDEGVTLSSTFTDTLTHQTVSTVVC